MLAPAEHSTVTAAGRHRSMTFNAELAISVQTRVCTSTDRCAEDYATAVSLNPLLAQLS